MLCRPPIWALVMVHAILLYLHKEMGMDAGMIVKGDPPDDISKVSTTFLIFFLVYYGGNCYARYYGMYNACMGMAGDVQCWVGLSRVYFPQASPDVLWNLCRHMVASVYFLYFELGGLASDGGRVITEAEWSVLFRSSLISASVRTRAGVAAEGRGRACRRARACGLPTVERPVSWRLGVWPRRVGSERTARARLTAGAASAPPPSPRHSLHRTRTAAHPCLAAHACSLPQRACARARRLRLLRHHRRSARYSRSTAARASS